ncbi:NIPSNAP family protein [Sphingobium sp. BYY-5]|uniref:NIPSNAP family protein n=1 Tax=Sphingobium sp. BYY-5 TaxID=2926400 RepID=UPI001FA6C13D|nr:NIPSNAP family protein [Sphingobium sp. BYY-5]MCI4591757.1 NIPSNAP family protein [Sphingobium sp. BYY-5]
MIDLLGKNMEPHLIFELRRYRLRPGGREPLIRLFDREFVEPQEALAMRVEGEFRDLEDPDAFVWVRSFRDMEARTEALQSFYSGPVWGKYGSDANATMLNSDNVLLLKSASTIQPFSRNLRREQEMQRPEAGGIVIANSCSLAPGKADDFARYFLDRTLPVIQEAGARVDATFVTEPSANGFRRLPVREGETVFVWFECHQDEASVSRYQEQLRQNTDWTDEIHPHMDGLCWRKIEVAYLTPTSRSLCAW